MKKNNIYIYIYKIKKYLSKNATYLLHGGTRGNDKNECNIIINKNIYEKINYCIEHCDVNDHALFNINEFYFVILGGYDFLNKYNIGFNYISGISENSTNEYFINLYEPSSELKTINEVLSYKTTQFFSPMRGIIEFEVGDESNIVIVNNWEKIKIGHGVRIWSVLNKNKEKTHIVTEIIIDAALSISFGISNLDELDIKFDHFGTRVARQEAILLSPDPMLNKQIEREYADPFNNYYELISQGAITEESYEKLQDFFKLFNPYTNCKGLQLMHNYYNYGKRFDNIIKLNNVKDRYIRLKNEIGDIYEEL